MTEVATEIGGVLLFVGLYVVPLLVGQVFGYRAAGIRSPVLRWTWYVFGFTILIYLALLFAMIVTDPTGNPGVPAGAALVGVIWGARRGRSGRQLIEPDDLDGGRPKLKSKASADRLME